MKDEEFVEGTGVDEDDGEGQEQEHLAGHGGGAGLRGGGLKGDWVEVEGAKGVEVERDGVEVGNPYVSCSLSSW